MSPMGQEAWIWISTGLWPAWQVWPWTERHLTPASPLTRTAPPIPPMHQPQPHMRVLVGVGGEEREGKVAGPRLHLPPRKMPQERAQKELPTPKAGVQGVGVVLGKGKAARPRESREGEAKHRHAQRKMHMQRQNRLMLTLALLMLPLRPAAQVRVASSQDPQSLRPVVQQQQPQVGRGQGERPTKAPPAMQRHLQLPHRRAERSPTRVEAEGVAVRAVPLPLRQPRQLPMRLHLRLLGQMRRQHLQAGEREAEADELVEVVGADVQPKGVDQQRTLRLVEQAACVHKRQTLQCD